jgi:hypothetical protein
VNGRFAPLKKSTNWPSVLVAHVGSLVLKRASLQKNAVRTRLPPRRAVLIAPVSTQIPCQLGIFCIFRTLSAISYRETGVLQSLLEQFPAKINREKI